MHTAYTVCMAVGIGLPLLSLAMSGLFDLLDGALDGLSDFLDGLDADISVEIGGTSISFLPLSMHSICAGLLLFGAVGKLMYTGENAVAANITGAACGYIAAVLVQSFVGHLKRVENSPPSKEQLLFGETRVTNTIVAGGYGAVSVRGRDGTSVSYPARAEDGKETIRQDTAVNIVRFEKNVAIVKKAGHSLKGQELTLFDS